MTLKNIPGWKHQPRPFQFRGIEFLEEHKGRGLIADEPGLGKTIQAIAWLWLHRREVRPVLVVCPNSVKLNWQREFRKWTGLPKAAYQVLTGGRGKMGRVGWALIVNYDILHRRKAQLQRLGLKAIVLDEAHYIKTRGAKRSKAVVALAKKVPHLVALTGTPVMNRPVEIFNTLRLIRPGLFRNFWEFAQRYCRPKYNGFGWNFNGSSNRKELRRLLCSTVMIRRRKKDVLKELPAKTRSVVPMEIDNRREYDRAENDFRSWIWSRGKSEKEQRRAISAEALVKVGVLKRLCAEGKMSSSIDWIEDLLETGEKLVVFAWHTSTLDSLEDAFEGRVVRIDGGTSIVNRQEAVDQFQNSKGIRLFIGNIQAAGVGITLTAASHVAFLELPWSPSMLDQAEDRLHRIGQTRAVNVWYLLAPDSIEMKIMTLLDRKRRVVGSIIDGVKPEKGEMLTKLLEDYRANKVQTT